MPIEGNNSSRFSNSSPSGPVPESKEAVGDEIAMMARVAPLTGRDTEVNLLKDRWEQANEGMGQVVLLIGEAGLGKSRLVHTLKEHVLGQMVEGEVDSPVIEWRCSPHFQNTGLHPAIDFFERALDFDLEKSPQAQFDRLLTRLEAYDIAGPETLSLWASLLGLPTSDRFPPLSLSPTRLREETFRIMREWLHTRAFRRPVLFVVEDLHWVDASTLEFLGQFITEGLHDRILTVLTFRPEFKTPWPAVAHQTSLALNRLTRRQVGELLGKSAAASLPQQLIDQIHERTGGVPLFVEELARLVREPKQLDHAAGEKTPCDLLDHGLPDTLRDLVVARLDGMTRNPEVAQLAATLGREFAYEVLAAVTTVSEDTLKIELATLVRSEILYQKGSPPRSTYMFKHALLEDALHGALATEKRQQFHRQIADALESRFPETAQTLPELLAHHFTEADMVEEAASYWLKAGLRCLERSANVEAIGHLTKGLALVRTLPESPERDAQELQFLSPLGTTYIAARGYASPEVGPVFSRARELADRIGQPAQRFVVMRGNFAWHVVRGNFKLCSDLAAEAIQFVETLNDPGMMMEALFLQGLTKFYRGDFVGARDHCSLALADFDDRNRTKFWATHTGEDSGVTHRCYLALILWHVGYPDRALQLSQETIALARSLGHPFTMEYALHHAGWLRQHCQLGDEAQAAADEQIAIATEQGFVFWHATGTLYRAAGLLLQGNLAVGLPLLVAGLESYRATGAELALPYYLSLLGDGYTRAGRFEDAHRALAEGLDLADKNEDRFQEAELHRLLGELHLAETDDQAAAEDCFRNAIQTARRQQSRAWELRATMSLARLWQRQDLRNEAHDALAAVFGTYTEGFTTPDLVDAKTLLETLGNERMRDDFAAGVKYVLGCIPPPMHGPVSIDWRFVPSSNLGGDSIGYHWIDDDHLALYLIDVMGHGLDSALLSVTITNVLRSGSLRGTDMRRPDQVLAKLNDAFPSARHGQKFFTAWYGVYKRSSRLLTWSGGGHHPSILLAPGAREPILLPSSGLLLGFMSEQEYPAESCEVVAGARLLIFSDGVFEILRDGEPVWDMDPCVEYLATRDSRGGALMDELLAHVRTLHGSHELADDFTILEACFPQDVRT
jgi:serine phosphatase RsbU (regulator of sigma subunit)